MTVRLFVFRTLLSRETASLGDTGCTLVTVTRPSTGLSLRTMKPASRERCSRTASIEAFSKRMLICVVAGRDDEGTRISEGPEGWVAGWVAGDAGCVVGAACAVGRSMGMTCAIEGDAAAPAKPTAPRMNKNLLTDCMIAFHCSLEP